MSRVKKGGLIVSVFSLAVAIVSFGIGFHTQKARMAESFKKDEVTNLELKSTEGSWILAVAKDCKKAGCAKDKEVYEADLRIDQTRRVAGEAYLIREVAGGVEKNYDKKAQADKSIVGMKNGEDIFLKLAPFGSAAGSEETDLTGVIFRDSCATGNYFKSDKTFGRFAAFKTTGVIIYSDIQSSLDQCANIN